MIGTLLRLPLFTFIGIVLSWGLSLAFASPSGLARQHLGTDLEQAFPSATERGRLLEGAETTAELLQGRLSGTFGHRTSDARASFVLSALHFGILLRILPVFSAVFVLGVLGGLASRERIRGSRGYASPSAAFIARHAVGLGVLWILVYSFSPLPLPTWSLLTAGAASASGGFFYMSNLPLRL